MVDFMRIPGFTAETSLPYSATSYRINKTYHGMDFHRYSEPMIVASGGKKDVSQDVPPLIVSDLYDFCMNQTVCASVQILEPCGSVPEGGTPPMCPSGRTETQCWEECVPF